MLIYYMNGGKGKIFLGAECQLINVERITEIGSTIWQLSSRWLIHAGLSMDTDRWRSDEEQDVGKILENLPTKC